MALSRARLSLHPDHPDVQSTKPTCTVRELDALRWSDLDYLEQHGRRSTRRAVAALPAGVAQRGSLRIDSPAADGPLLSWRHRAMSNTYVDGHLVPAGTNLGSVPVLDRSASLSQPTALRRLPSANTSAGALPPANPNHRQQLLLSPMPPSIPTPRIACDAAHAPPSSGVDSRLQIDAPSHLHIDATGAPSRHR
ncbi:hypothetical protein OsI_13617 [Oryza sativa Indica Group]|uniref:Uncharacterized protein n=1 Tax=Oryza sativa subsp. indica TaxID=39946 RepID=B8AK80_ORYSI|nr:hypothetical protein OsI_13617 [Oryza sativa Indica Group]